MPTTSDGLEGLIDSVFSSVFTRRPPITRSYSRPSSLRTFSIAARMRRVFSGLLQSMEGSLANCSGIGALLMVAARRVPWRAGVIVVAISAVLSGSRFRQVSLVKALLIDAGAHNSIRGLQNPLFYTGSVTCQRSRQPTGSGPNCLEVLPVIPSARPLLEAWFGVRSCFPWTGE